MKQREAMKQRKEEVRRATRSARTRTAMATWSKIMANLTSPIGRRRNMGTHLCKSAHPR
jgi:hypothetical protein